ncbi:MAG TPA: 16S rRNA (guanine(527)-N(7))-methyltransferase RsmG [Desulfobacteraceae bacterium]|nr:16S rRNA (guanine(527)-N(7))-methyltransferase RsmG [Desulfobacteraceae bacterium]
MNFQGKWKETVEAGLLQLGVRVDGPQLDLMALHGRELVKWNRKFNITSIVDPFEAAVRHFIDSAALAAHLSDHQRVLDIGSGGGFPGLPLKIVNPGLDVVMVDASRKRISFVNHVIRSAALSRVTAVHERCEDLALKEGFAQGFDSVVSRAFTSLDRFIVLAMPFVSENGSVLAMKGKEGGNEAKSLAGRYGRVDVHDYVLPFEKHHRSIVTVRP